MADTKVYLSFGRHERYGFDTPILREDMVAAYLIGVHLRQILPPCATVYHSPLERAAETARFEALGMNCPHLLETEFLTESAPKFTVQKFVNNVLTNTDHSVQYYHFVTHLPVVEKLGLPFLGAGDVCLLTADNWTDMLAENFSVQTMRRPEVQAFLWMKWQQTSQNLEKLSPDDIYRLLQKQEAK